MKKRRNSTKNIEIQDLDEKPIFLQINSAIQIKEPYHLPLRDVYRYFSIDDKIELQPDFQRDYIWPKNKQTELVRSLWRGIPLPMFYFAVTESGKWEVIDGQQRLTTIFGYINPTSIKNKEVRNKLIKKAKILDSDKK